MTDPNTLNWEQAISDENYQAAAEIEARAARLAKVRTEMSPHLEAMFADMQTPEAQAAAASFFNATTQEISQGSSTSKEK